MRSKTQTATPDRIDLRDALPHGAQAQIAEKLTISPRAVSKALATGRPGSPVVMLAKEIIARAEKAAAESLNA